MSYLGLGPSPAEGPGRAPAPSGPQLPSLQCGVSTPDWGIPGRLSEATPPTCSRAHLDGERDVCVGAEAPAPVAGAVVEAAACEDSRGVARARLKAQTPPSHLPPRAPLPAQLPGMAPGSRLPKSADPAWACHHPWVRRQLCHRGHPCPQWHQSCCPQDPGQATGHSPMLIAQPRSTASFPAFGNKHRMRGAGGQFLHLLIH